jgi:putative membrane protein
MTQHDLVTPCVLPERANVEGHGEGRLWRRVYYNPPMSLIIRWILNTLALFLVVKIVPGYVYEGWVTLAIAAAVLGLLNAIVRPILFVLTLPLTVVTLGLFLLVLNAIMLELTAWVVPGFDIQGFGWAVVGALVLSIVSLVTGRIGKEEERG